jgi:hypothetical protein
MRSLSVHARCAFPSWDHRETAWRDQDRDWQLLVLAIKGDAARMKQRSARLALGEPPVMRTVDRTTVPQAGRWYGNWVAKRTRQLGIERPVFVAIPNRNALLDAKDFRTAEYVRQAAESYGEGASAFSGLRFKTFVSKEEKKRQGFQELKDNMVLIEPVPDGELILVDDVYTQGHHLGVAVSLLPRDREPKHAFVAGRTVLAPLENMGAELTEQHWIF